MAIQATFVELLSQASRRRWPPGPGSRDTLAAHPPAAVGRAQLAAAPSAPPPGRKCGAATVPPQPSPVAVAVRVFSCVVLGSGEWLAASPPRICPSFCATAPGASGRRDRQAGGEETAQDAALRQVLGWRTLPEAPASWAQALRRLDD